MWKSSTKEREQAVTWLAQPRLIVSARAEPNLEPTLVVAMPASTVEHPASTALVTTSPIPVKVVAVVLVTVNVPIALAPIGME